MKDLLPAYAAGSLTEVDRERVGAHLAACPRCRAELAVWRAIADAAVPSGGASDHAKIDAAPDAARVVRAVLTASALGAPAQESGAGRPTRRLRHLASLVAAEARLIRLAVPLASALVMALGLAIIVLGATTGDDPSGGAGDAGVVLALFAPIVAAAGIAGAYRSRRDPVAELIAATPTSGRLLLLVRVALVFGYDLLLVVSASTALSVADVGGVTSLNALVAAWLGPMALLSALSLLVSVWSGPDVALGAAMGLWAVRVLAGDDVVRDAWPAQVIVDAWSTNAPVLAISVVVTGAAVFLAGRVGPLRGEPSGGWRATHPM